MEMSKQEYQKYVKERAQSSPLVKDCLLAFAIGGGICVVGQLVMDGYTGMGLEKTDAGTATSITMVFLSVLLTGLNLYNNGFSAGWVAIIMVPVIESILMEYERRKRPAGDHKRV